MMEPETNTETPPVGDRPLRRSSTDRIFAGVARGIATRLDIPAWVVRVAFVVLAFGGGLGIALYIAGWLLIPKDDETEPIARGLLGRVQDGSGWLGVALVGIGVLIAASSVDFIRGDLAVAVFLGVIGVMLYRGELGTASLAPTEPTVPTSPNAPGAPSFVAGDVAPTEPPLPPQPTRPPSILGRVTIAFVLIATGVMAFFDYALADFDPALRHYMGLALAIVGVALVVGSVMGRARGLIVVGIVLTPLLVLSPLADLDLNGGIGQRRVAVDSIEELSESYELAIGELVIDLRGIDFGSETVELDASVGIGSLHIIIPDGIGVELDGEVGIGDAEAFGASRSGIARELDVSREGVGTLVLEAQTLIGELQVSGSEVASFSRNSIDLVITSPAQLQDVYELDLGNITLDLSGLVLTEPRTVRISNGLGRIHVIVADRTTTSVEAEADIGQVTVFGTTQGGFDTTVEAHPRGPQLLTLEIEIDSGEIVVEEG
ncbi:MAG: LiaF domain-containing protein [Acidimicrobiia bacterium]